MLRMTHSTSVRMLKSFGLESQMVLMTSSQCALLQLHYVFLEKVSFLACSKCRYTAALLHDTVEATSASLFKLLSCAAAAIFTISAGHHVLRARI